jgi:hypothetical protein
MEWVVQADQRSSFREPVSLNDGVTEAAPEFLRFGRQRSASRDQCPEFLTKARVNAAETPPAPQEFLAIRALEIAAKFPHLALGLQISLELVAQRFDQSWHGNEDRDTLAANRSGDVAGAQRIEKDRCAAENLRDEDSEHLAEDVAQRQ